MSPSPSANSNIDNETRASHGRYRVYVCVITATTIILLALLAWPFTVKHFRSTAEVRLVFDASSIEFAEANRLIARSIANHTTDEKLIARIEQIHARVPCNSHWLANKDVIQLRQQIQVATRQGSKPNSLELRISMIGSGSQDEIEFVNQLSNAVSNELVQGDVTPQDRRVVEQWAANFIARLDEQNEFLFQATGLLNEQLDLAIDQRNSVYQQLPNLAFSETQDTDEISTINLQHEIARNYQLMQTAQAQNNWPANHPELIAFQQKIDVLKGRLNQLYQTGGTYRVRNQFMNASNSTDRTASMDMMLKQMEMKELDTSSLIIEKIQKQLTDNRREQKHLVSGIRAQLTAKPARSNALQMERLELAATAEPLGGMPGSRQLLSLAVLALMLGGVMAWQYKPEMRLRTFQSAEHASSVLGLPSIGVLRDKGRPAAGTAGRKWIVTGLFKACEYILLCLAVMLIIAMLVNSELFGAAMRNPFESISKAVWMISPR